MYRVAVVGRPNVGKSTLFNRLTGTRRAIVGNEPGITRDRIIEIANWDGKDFEVIDTGGILPDEKDLIPEKILEQAGIALEDSNLVLFVVDIRDGLTPLDQSLFSLVRTSGKACFLVANKADDSKLIGEALQFHRLGVEKVFPVSAEHSLGVYELLEAIGGRVEGAPAPPPREEVRIAIIGRPNVGKSSLLNRFVGRERVIVSEIPGTTRDSIDTLLTARGRHYRLIDTAGIRRKGKTELMAEKLSVVMARKSIIRCDVALLVVDASEGATKLDAHIGGYAHDAGKSLVVVVNKWDLVEKDTHTALRKEKEIRERMRFLEYAPILFVSALSGQRVAKILDVVDRAYQARNLRVPTAELNQVIEKAIPSHLRAASPTGKSPYLYATQAAISPPTFVVFTRSRKPMHFSTMRHLSNELRRKFGFFGTPLRILQRVRRKR